MDNTLLKKYLGRKVVVFEKIYGHISAVRTDALQRAYRVEGTVTGVDDNFIEIDNKILVQIQFIYQIKEQ